MAQYYSPHCTLQKIQLVDQYWTQVEGGIVSNNTPIVVKLDFIIEELHPALCLGIAVYNRNNELLFWSYHTDNSRESWISLKTGTNSVLVEIPKNLLNEGLYIIRPLISLHHIEWIMNPDNNEPYIEFSIKGGLSESPIWNEARPGILAPILKYTALIINLNR
jgi:lipopolysaccharide transport system ATP-binding protein